MPGPFQCFYLVSSRRVAPSRYGYYRDGAVVNTVDDALTATVDIDVGRRTLRTVWGLFPCLEI